MDGITAAAAVAGVIVAVLLGLRAIRLASRTVDRSALDYAATRADLATHWRVSMNERMADVKANLHVYWKEDPSLLLAADPNSERARELLEDRKVAEAEVHRSIYLLDSAAVRLKETLPSVQVRSGIGDDATDIGAEGQERAAAIADFYTCSAMALYFTLVPEKPVFTDPKVDPDAFRREFIQQLQQGGDSSVHRSIIDEIDSWLMLQLRGEAGDQRTPEIIAINFIERFLDQNLADAVGNVVDGVLIACRARVELVSAN